MSSRCRFSDGERVFHGFVGDQGYGFADQALDRVALSRSGPIFPNMRNGLIGTIPLSSPSSAEVLLWSITVIRFGLRIALDVNYAQHFGIHVLIVTLASFWLDSHPTPPFHRLPHQASRQEALWFFNVDDPEDQHPPSVPMLLSQMDRLLSAGNLALRQASSLLFTHTPLLIRLVPVTHLLPGFCITGLPRPWNVSA